MKNKFYNPEISHSKNELVAALQLSRSKNIGPITFLKLMAKFGRPSEAIYSTENLLKSKSEKLKTRSEAEDEIAAAEKHGAKIISIFDEYYPALLAEIADPPIILTVKGDYTRITADSAAMVGARYSSANAMSFAYKLGNELCERKITVISGLARGIDTAAHKGALKCGACLPTVAVTAGGIDNIYPTENASLFEEIAAQGVILTENSFGITPKAEHFPRRNRIISGMSQVVCIVEAALKSGSLITARFALEQGREIAAVPGFPLDPRSEGTNILIKKGASLVTSANDIAELMKNYKPDELRNDNFFNEKNFDFIAGDEKDGIDLMEVLGTTPVSVNELMSLYGFEPAYINAKLLEHEITGEIIRHPGNKVSRING